jgi:hypothetical protein
MWNKYYSNFNLIKVWFPRSWKILYQPFFKTISSWIALWIYWFNRLEMVYWTSTNTSCDKKMVYTGEINIIATSSAVLCCALLCCVVHCCAVLCTAVLCCALLCCFLHCCALLCTAVLCFALLCSAMCSLVQCSPMMGCAVHCCAARRKMIASYIAVTF